jgi:dipeptidyl-peptidase 9
MDFAPLGKTHVKHWVFFVSFFFVFSFFFFLFFSVFFFWFFFCSAPLRRPGPFPLKPETPAMSAGHLPGPYTSPRAHFDSLAAAAPTAMSDAGDELSAGNKSATDKLSLEEELQRERRRVGSSGIATFDLHPVSGAALVLADGALFVSDAACGGVAQRLPIAAGGVVNPRWSACGTMVSYVRAGDVHVFHVAAAVERRVTFARTIATPERSAGLPEYVMQEEFDRYAGYWWAPRAAEDPRGPMLAYLEVDESMVETVHVPGSPATAAAPGGAPEEHRYPRVGQANAVSELCVIAVRDSLTTPAPTTAAPLRLDPPLHERFPWCEYAVRCGWTPDAEAVWVQILDREQCRTALVLFPLDQFSRPGSPAAPRRECVAVEESSAIWINVDDLTTFLPTGEIVWASETATGFRHLHLLRPRTARQHITCENGNTNITTNDNNNNIDNIDNIDNNDNLGANPAAAAASFASSPVHPPLSMRGEYDVAAITAGDGWQVDDGPIAVDAEQRFVLFTGTRDTPLQCHLYAAALDGDGGRPTESPVRLTAAGFNHAVHIDPTARAFLATRSNVGTWPQTAVFRVVRSTPAASSMETGTGVERLVSVPMATCAPIRSAVRLPIAMRPPRLLQFSNRHGIPLYGALYAPDGPAPRQSARASRSEAGCAHPLVLFVYAGPHVQLVTDDFRTTHAAQIQVLCHLGFYVLVVDGVGSWRRGLGFEGAIRHAMGTVEIQDQVDAVKLLCSRMRGAIDPARVAITGSSYGGYASLLGL